MMLVVFAAKGEKFKVPVHPTLLELPAFFTAELFRTVKNNGLFQFARWLSRTCISITTVLNTRRYLANDVFV